MPRRSYTIQATDREWETICSRANEAGMPRSQFIMACALAPDPEESEHEEPTPLTDKEAQHLYRMIVDIGKALNHLTAPMPHAKWYDPDTGEEYHLDMRAVLQALFLKKSGNPR